MARRGRNGQTTTTLYDGWNPIQLKEGTTVIENRLAGLGLDETYARTRDGVTESYLTDALGSTVELRDGTKGQTTQYTYEPYGGTTQAVASTNVAKYTGREQDIADLYYYRNRYYKPSIGRFISEDPIGIAGGSNTYTYVGNNPANWVDPLGLTGSEGRPGDLGPLLGAIIDKMLPGGEDVDKDAGREASRKEIADLKKRIDECLRDMNDCKDKKERHEKWKECKKLQRQLDELRNRDKKWTGPHTDGVPPPGRRR